MVDRDNCPWRPGLGKELLDSIYDMFHHQILTKYTVHLIIRQPVHVVH